MDRDSRPLVQRPRKRKREEDPTPSEKRPKFCPLLNNQEVTTTTGALQSGLHGVELDRLRDMQATLNVNIHSVLCSLTKGIQTNLTALATETKKKDDTIMVCCCVLQLFTRQLLQQENQTLKRNLLEVSHSSIFSHL
jgi:hypothetical protein